jgi:aryl-alcohol dehydrogenase-like predicted oxidoreductase
MTQLALGTVQFGTAYGITNSSGKVPEHEVRTILSAAAANGVEILDTAAAYGDAERVLGRCMPQNAYFRIITKTVPLRTAQIDEEALQKVSAGIANSLNLLSRSPLDGVMVHHAQDLLVPGGDQLFALLKAEQSEGRIGKVGVSVYDAEQLAALIPRYPIELVQIPLNVLDQRLLKSGWIRRLHDAGIEIHVRSAFLQGTLLVDADTLPDGLGVIKAGVSNFQNFCNDSRHGYAQVCLGFLRSMPEVSQVVCGVASFEQFAEISSAWEQAPALNSIDYSLFSLPNHPLLSPSNWPA